MQAAIRELCARNRFNVLVCHRRFGKTVFAINKLKTDVLQCPLPNARGHYFAPTYKQAKSIAWDYLQEYTRHIRGMKYNKTELSASFPRGQRIQLVGADNPDSFRGQYSDSLVCDEIAMMPPRMWTEVARPALSDRLGKALFIGTPAGRNAFYDLYERAGELDDWGRILLKHSDTGVIDPNEISALRREMPDYEFEQEYNCSFVAAVRGAFYGRYMAEAEEQGRITDVPYTPDLPVFTSCDLGYSDAYAVWWWQISPGGEYRAIDYEEYHNHSIPEVIAKMREKPYQNYEMHIAPHDIKVRELGTGTSRIEVAAKHGIRYNVAPNLSLQEGIDATKNLIRKAWFDKTRCKVGINHLQLYRADIDQKTDKIKKMPIHDHTSHGADAARYFATTMGARTGNTWGQGINYDMLDKVAV